MRGDKGRVDIDLAEVVDDHGRAQTFGLRQQMVEQRRLAGAEIAADDRERRRRSSRLPCVDALAFLEGLDGLDLRNLLDRRRHRICVEDDDIGELALLYRSLLPSSRSCQAASMVSAFSAVQGLTRWSGPMTTPLRDVRSTAVCTMRMGSAGVTEKSLWFEQCKPLARADPIGLRKKARSCPRFSRWTSPQKNACTVKKLGEKPARHRNRAARAA